jgi:hypothetical protein
MVVGIESVEDMVIYRRGQAEMALRCPKCGAIVHITTPAPVLPAPMVEAISEDFGIPFEDGKLVLSKIMDAIQSGNISDLSLTIGFGDGSGFDYFDEDDAPKLEERKLTEADENKVGYFSSELDKIDSVDDFLKRTEEGD